MDFKLGRATSFPASLDCPDRVLALSAGHAEGHRYSFLDSTARTARTTRLELQYYPRPDDRTSELNLGFPELNLGFYWCSGMLR
ncbi:hypothetical protein F2Q70_00003818 [Brassica cretica]|uniref:Uncharacterized protein n=1 Tax=Brassica cretica TaxID=69181 RepID=A0A8S9IPJ3_BRACR|nr:hypothetical protein F2Q70_00003818 [Brassica cretica]